MRFWLAMLGLLTLLRLIVAGCAPLSADEAYYWTWSHALAPGYLDHPPMTALWIRAGTLLFGDDPFGVRLLSPIAAGLGTLLLAAACNDLLGGTRPTLGMGGGGGMSGGGGGGMSGGVVAALLLNATLLLGVGAVTMTPDTPLLFFWTAALFALGRLIATRGRGWWLAVGVAIGLALDSKYTVVLPGGGLALWLLATREGRFWLRTPWPWLAAGIVLLLFAPVLWWNGSHGWASFLKQGGRNGDWHPAAGGRYLVELLGGQIGLATPFIFILFAAGLIRVARHPFSASPGRSLLAFVTLPAMLVFIEHALGDRVQANWPGLLYPACAIAAASLDRKSPLRDWRLRGAAGFGLLLTVLVYLQSTLAPVSLPRRFDITLMRLAGWQELADAVSARAAAEAGGGFIMADEYGLASELAFSLPDHGVLGAEPRWRLFALPHPDVSGRTGLLLRTARRKDAPDGNLFFGITLLGELQRGRAGRVAETYRLYRVTMRADLPGTLRDEIVRLPSGRP